MKRLVLGTRGSELARAQTALVENALRAVDPQIDLVIQAIATRGDETTAADPQGRKGLFTREIERALLGREIDVAVHSAKDLPSESTDGLEISAVLPRAAIEDVLVTKQSGDLTKLRADATVATGSVRRQHQLRWKRGDVNVVDLRGNVPTRLRKLVANDWDAIILARAGLERLGFNPASGSIEFEGETLRTSILSQKDFLPAGGQGIVALQIRADDAEKRRATTTINHPPTLRHLRAEREFLRLLQGDCGTPVGVLALEEDGGMTLRAQVFEAPEREPRTAASVRNPNDRSPELIARMLFSLMYGSKE